MLFSVFSFKSPEFFVRLPLNFFRIVYQLKENYCKKIVGTVAKKIQIENVVTSTKSGPFNSEVRSPLPFTVQSPVITLNTFPAVLVDIYILSGIYVNAFRLPLLHKPHSIMMPDHIWLVCRYRPH